jgi:hypothetical protein
MAARERQPALPHAAERFLDGLCGLDIDEAASNLDASIRLSAGFQRLAAGRIQVRSLLLRAMTAIDGLEYRMVATWVRRDVAILEADVRCTRADSALVQFPATVVFRFSGELIAEIKVWIYEPAIASAFGGLRLMAGLRTVA